MAVISLNGKSPECVAMAWIQISNLSDDDYRKLMDMVNDRIADGSLPGYVGVHGSKEA